MYALLVRATARTNFEIFLQFPSRLLELFDASTIGQLVSKRLHDNFLPDEPIAEGLRFHLRYKRTARYRTPPVTLRSPCFSLFPSLTKQTIGNKSMNKYDSGVCYVARLSSQFIPPNCSRATFLIFFLSLWRFASPYSLDRVTPPRIISLFAFLYIVLHINI